MEPQAQPVEDLQPPSFERQAVAYPHFPDYLNEGFLDWAKETCRAAGQRVNVSTSSPKGGTVYIAELPCFGETLVVKNPTTGLNGEVYKEGCAFYDPTSGERIEADEVSYFRGQTSAGTKTTLED